MKATIKYILIGLVAVVAVLAGWPYRLIASPSSKIRVVDDSGRPLTGGHLSHKQDWEQLRSVVLVLRFVYDEQEDRFVEAHRE